MCGLVGIFDLRGPQGPDRQLLHRMNESQSHRGPDECHLYLEPGLGLGHRRLAVIDLGGGQQPMFNEDRSVVVVFNGEIYNFQGLKEELQSLGHSFHTHSDTEVIVHAWEQWGTACVVHFRGMFAFALWDRHRETLFLARDRLGIKPLFYAELPNGELVFSSELKALYLHPSLSRELDPRSVEDYFGYGYVPEPRTILRQAFKLPPGHQLTVTRQNGVGRPVSYWDIPFRPGSRITEAQAQEELIERLREAIRIHLVTEVPLGAFLSGGVDSSGVVAIMAGLSDDPIPTCSISYGNPNSNGSEFVRRIVERYHTDHQVEQVDADDFSLVDRLVDLYDEPFADSSAIPTYRLCEVTRKHVTVALSGDGGDENLAGYRRYRVHTYEERLRARLPRGLRRVLFDALGRHYPKLDWAPKVLRAKVTLQALARDSVEGYYHSVSLLHDGMRRHLFSEDFQRDLQGYRAVEVLAAHAARAPTDHPLSLVQYLDMKTHLAGDILTKVDRASMAHGLEVRMPLLDHTLVEWLSSLPPDLKLRGREGKYLLKKVLEPHVPDELLYQSKRSFSVPLASGLRGPLRQRLRDALLGPVLAETGMFQRSYLAHLLDQHQAGLHNYSVPLWSLLMFEAFLRKMQSGNDNDPGRTA
jgi:asparagine synthase (glutamine-hydrolysing)